MLLYGNLLATRKESEKDRKIYKRESYSWFQHDEEKEDDNAQNIAHNDEIKSKRRYHLKEARARDVQLPTKSFADSNETMMPGMAGKDVGHATVRPNCSAFVQPFTNDEQSPQADSIPWLAIKGPARGQTLQKSISVLFGHENDAFWILQRLLLMPSQHHQACTWNRARCVLEKHMDSWSSIYMSRSHGVGR